jgi:disulfide bond formation protein DsbB
MSKSATLPKWLYDNAAYIAWAQALVALLLSLYFSEIKHFAPCLLCWYQRILMYPLVFILAVGILRKDKGLHWYVLPLSIIGMGIAAYHYLLQAGVIPESAAPCTLGVSCLTKYEVYLRVFTIPLLSFIAFILITLCMLILWHGARKRP